MPVVAQGDQNVLNSVAESRAIPNKLEADIERLNALAESHRAEYAQAGP